MRCLGLCILVLLGTYDGVTQSVNWSDPIKTTREISQVTVAGTDETGFYVVEENKKEKSIRLIRYNLSDSKQQWSETIEVPSGALDQEFESLLHLKDRFFFFTSGFSRESEQFQVYCTILDASGKKTGDPALVHYTLSEGRDLAPRFGYSLSPDSTRVLLYFDPPGERKTTEALSFKLYDNELDLVMEKELLLPYTQEIVQVHSFLTDNDGNIYMMSGRNPAKNSTMFQRPQGSRYVVFFYNHKENKLKEYDVSLKEKQVVSVVFGFNSAQDVIITGYYSNDFKFASAGTFLFMITAHGGPVKAASFMPFAKDFLAKFMRSGEEGETRALADFFLDHIIIHEDGTMLLIGEQYYATESLVMDPITGRQIVEFRYNFDDILVTKLETNGRQAWNVKVPKRQYVSSDLASCSYQYFSQADGVSLFFNDNDNNLQKLAALPEGEASGWSGTRNSITSHVKVSGTGSITREMLINNKDINALMKTDLGSSHASGPPVLGYEDSKSYKFCVVK